LKIRGYVNKLLVLKNLFTNFIGGFLMLSKILKFIVVIASAVLGYLGGNGTIG